MKIFSLEKADSKKTVFRIPYYRVSGISESAFDKRGRTLVQTLKQAKLNSRNAIGIGSLNVGANLFFDFPIKETQSVNFRFNIGSVGYIRNQQTFNLNYQKVNAYEQYTNGWGNTFYNTSTTYNAPEGPYENYLEFDYVYKRPKINFFMDFEPRFYWTGRKSTFKPYTGLILGFNSSDYFYLIHEERETQKTNSNNTSTTYSNITVSGQMVSKFMPHVGSSIGVEIYFGRKISLGAGYKIIINESPKDKIRERYRYYDIQGNLSSSSTLKYTYESFVNHLFTIDLKYLLDEDIITNIKSKFAAKSKTPL